MRRLAMVVSAILVFGFVVAARGAAAAPVITTAAAAPVITVDGQSSGRTFDGLGGESAGTSALLMDYPARQRSEILDYLFKPDYGASLQILKVEIGGGTFDTDGSEHSHEPEPGQIDCNSGYEWWLMEQAKARNPNIKFYGLEWGAPGWVGNLFTNPNNITYLLDWLGCAKSHGLTISYLGGWNEFGFNAAFFENLRSALDSHGYANVQVSADDQGAAAPFWGVAPALSSDPKFNAAVNVVSQHDPCQAAATQQCPSTTTAQSLDKPLWNSEQGVNVYNVNAADLAREINRDYVDGKITALIAWSLVWSAYSSLPLQGTGLMLANTPWSGNYTVDNTMIWAMAHTTQFAQPGWQYLDSGSVPLSGGGSVATLRSPTGDDWSSIIETSNATTPQTVKYQVQGGLSKGTVHVWATNTKSTDPDQWFAHVADIQPQDGSFDMTLQPGYIYSLTTTTGQGKGTATPPAASPWQLPYHDNFDSYPAGVSPRLFSDVGGAFDTQPCTGRSGMCLQQEVTQQPVQWISMDNYPLTVVGDPTSWSNYQVGVDAMLEQPGYVELDGRSPATQGRTQGFFSSPVGYHFRISDTGQWSIYKQDVASKTTTLASGTASFGVGSWHRLGLRMRGEDITASLDGHPLATVVDATYQAGQVALEVSPWDKAQFDNLGVEATPVQGQAQGPQLGAVTPNPVQLAPATGDSAQLATTVTNPGPLPASTIDAKLQLPAGWTATPITSPPANLGSGQSAPLAWQVTAPASAAQGLYQAGVTVIYKEDGLDWTASTDASVLVHGQAPELGAVTPNPVQIAAPGDSAQLTTTVTNFGGKSASPIDAKLQLPAGWTATPTSPAPATLGSGQSAPLAWQVTAPASAVPGPYQATVTVTWTEGGQNWTASTDAPVQLGTLIDSTSSKVTTTGSWYTLPVTRVNLIGGSEATGLTPGGTATIPFTGTRAVLFALKDVNLGIMDIDVDGTPAGTVDLYNPTLTPSQPVFDTGELPAGPHTLKLVITGNKNPASHDDVVDWDAVFSDPSGS